MKQTPQNTSGKFTFQEKVDYANRYLRHEAGPERRAVGMTLQINRELKTAVRLLAPHGTSARSYASAIIREHLTEFAGLHEYIRRIVYDHSEPGDSETYSKMLDKYVAIYLNPANRIEAEAWLSVDKELVRAMKLIVNWLDNGTTVASYVTTIFEHHFAKYGAMLDEMKTDTYLAQP